MSEHAEKLIITRDSIIKLLINEGSKPTRDGVEVEVRSFEKGGVKHGRGCDELRRTYRDEVQEWQRPMKSSGCGTGRESSFDRHAEVVRVGGENNENNADFVTVRSELHHGYLNPT